VTFLFTDIEGSTRRWEADAQSMRAALLAHDEVLRTAIETHDGFLFSHTGDGVVAAFASPKAAVDAAVDAQRELELPVRMGIATGEAELRDGDYFGTVLNRAARVMAAGHGGQVLLADSTASLLNGIDLLNLGPRWLRDVPVPVTVFQVLSPGLATDFPPLRTVEAKPGNLRTAGTKLIGRDTEAARLGAELRSRRLITLTGVGGVGKTTLALEVARQLANEFPDGVWLFELAAVADAESVPDAVAAVLGVTQQPGKSVGESVAFAMKGRVRLLVFDNCEHIRDAAADLIDLILAQSSTVTVLATSREMLDVANEQIWPVRSLDVDAASSLFIERAHSVAPGFIVDDHDAVMEICRRLDGIPLAIELAASRVSSMTLGDVRDRLDRRFKLLVGSRRNLERHQTLRHAVQWSYDLLDDAEKLLLERCSVFAGGFEVQSACAIAGSDDPDDFVVVDLLQSLARKSLLVVDRSAKTTRFSMLETIRQFAEEQLAIRGEGDMTRDAHARHFAAREADLLATWDSPRQGEAYDWLSLEMANLRTAFRWAADQNNLDDAVTIATYAGFLGFCIENYEPVVWAEELIDAARAASHRRLIFLYQVASQCWFVGRIEDAVRYSDAGQAAMRSGSGEIPFGLEGMLANPYLAIGQPDRCVEWCRAQFPHTEHTQVTAFLVTALTIAGREKEAIVAADGLPEAGEATRNPYMLSLALLAYGFAWRNADPDRALQAMLRGVVLARDSGNRFNETHLTANLAELAVERGDPNSALDHMGLAIRHLHDSGNSVTLNSPLTNLAILLDRLGRHEAAATIAGFALSPLSAASFPKINTTIAHLRGVLGDEEYESLARRGEVMPSNAMVAFAYEQIEQARTELEQRR
jgi:predicted ATPase